MNDKKITVTFKGGKRRVLHAPDTLPTIDGRRKAYFVLNNLQVYMGYSDGEIDATGDFCVSATNFGLKKFAGIGLPVRRLIGWAYVNPKRAKR
ncbi:MAG: hypothetical protein HDS16_01265 [Bacteroides sp.]|nr:hypothetical protein [Bacteroides sp.]